MMTGKHCSGKVIKIAQTGVTTIFLAGRLSGIATLFSDLSPITMRTTYTIRPTFLANSLITSVIVKKVFDV